MERLPDEGQPLLNQLCQIPQLLFFGFDTGCALASTAFTVLTLAEPCFVVLEADEALQLDLASPILHLFLQSLPCLRQSDFGQLAGPPGQHAFGPDTACTVCAWVFEEPPAEAIGQGPQSPLFAGVQLLPHASSAVPAPSTSTSARDRAMEKMYFFKEYSLKMFYDFMLSR